MDDFFWNVVKLAGCIAFVIGWVQDSNSAQMVDVLTSETQMTGVMAFALGLLRDMIKSVQTLFSR